MPVAKTPRSGSRVYALSDWMACSSGGGSGLWSAWRDGYACQALVGGECVGVAGAAQQDQFGSGVAGLKLAHGRVALCDGRTVGAVDVERQDAFDLMADLARWERARVGHDQAAR